MATIKNRGYYKLWKHTEGGAKSVDNYSFVGKFISRKSAKRKAKELYGSNGRATFLGARNQVRS